MTIILTVLVYFVIGEVLNENSPICVLPKKDDDGLLSEEEYKEYKKKIEEYEKLKK